MPDTRTQFDQLPIVRELGDDLRAAFERHEHQARVPASAVPSWRRWLLPAGGLTVAAAVAGVLALTSGIDSGHVNPPAASAAQALRQAAAAAEDHAAPFPRDDQFFYVRSRTTSLVGPASGAQADTIPTALVTKERSIWTSIDRTGRLQERIVATRFVTQAERQKWERVGRPTLGATPATATGQPISIAPTRTYRLGTIELTRQQMLDFPTDPRVIYQRLLAQVANRGNSPNGEVFTELGDDLRESPAPAKLRAALYRALALVPGVKLLGHVTDSVGRNGTAVAFTETGVRHELIFDTTTSEMLGEREVLIDPKATGVNLPAGTIIADDTYLQRAATDQPVAP